MGDPVGIYLLKVNNRNTRKRSEICSKLKIKTPKQRHWCRSGVFIINFEHISHFEHVNADWREGRADPMQKEIGGPKRPRQTLLGEENASPETY